MEKSDIAMCRGKIKMLHIKNGYIMTMAGNDIECGDILVKDGKITQIGKNIVLGDGEASVIDASGCIVMPGMIDANCQTGLALENERFYGDDSAESSQECTPQVRAIDGFKPFSEYLQDTLDSGVTSIGLSPKGGNVIGGLCSVLRLGGKSPDTMVIKLNAGMRCTIGEGPKAMFGKKYYSGMGVTRLAQAAYIREMLIKTKEYDAQKKYAEDHKTKMPKYDMKLEAMLPVVHREMPLSFVVYRAGDMYTAIRIAHEFDVDYVLNNCAEAHMITEDLKEAGAKCVLGPIAPLSKMKFEERNITERAPAILEEHGISFALSAGGMSLPTEYTALQAGLCAANGLSLGEAFKSVTINAAKILGVDDKIGSLEVGKDADIVIFDGNPLKKIQAKAKYKILCGKIV